MDLRVAGLLRNGAERPTRRHPAAIAFALYRPPSSEPSNDISKAYLPSP